MIYVLDGAINYFRSPDWIVCNTGNNWTYRQTWYHIPDGGKIAITYSDGSKDEKTCRYIDEYHVEVDSNLYHICEFAERMQQNENKVEPVGEVMVKQSRGIER